MFNQFCCALVFSAIAVDFTFDLMLLFFGYPMSNCRALARTPFLDDCLHVELPHDSAAGSALAQATLAAVTVLSLVTLLPTFPIWLICVLNEVTVVRVGEGGMSEGRDGRFGRC